MTLAMTVSTPEPRTSGSPEVSAPPVAVILGPPGSGKGTQCARLAERLGVVHVSTGDVLRDEMRLRSRLGRRVGGYVDIGALVPDGLVLEVVHEALERHQHADGVLLDGFPRTIDQAEGLGRLRNEVRVAVALVVPRNALVRRLAERGRADDRPEVVRRRLASYQRETRPLLDWYAARGVLVHVDGDRATGEITRVLTRLVRNAGVGGEPAPRP